MPNAASESGFHFISDYQRCNKYFYWRYVKKLVSKYPATALLFGRAIHETLAEWFKTMAVDIIPIFKTQMELIKDEFAEEAWYDEKMTDGLAMLESFLFNVPRTWQPIAIEEPVETLIPVTGGSVKLTGRVDLVVKNDGMVYIVDHKTTGWGLASLCQSLSVSDQATCYLLLWNQSHSLDLQANGVIFNIMRKNKSVVECKQHLVMKTTDDLRRFRGDASYLLSEIMRKTTTPDQCFPMNTGSCFNFNKPCPYLDLCKGIPYEALIGSQYIIDNEGGSLDEGR
jgi:hypothetical protein